MVEVMDTKQNNNKGKWRMENSLSQLLKNFIQGDGDMWRLLGIHIQQRARSFPTVQMEQTQEKEIHYSWAADPSPAPSPYCLQPQDTQLI